MKIEVDVRELALIQEIESDSSFPFPMEKRQLDIGDIIFYNDEEISLISIPVFFSEI